jgi:hypothetical protein
MRPLGKPMIGLEAEMKLIVSLEMTIGHLVAGMPYVYATPMMVLHMEMAAASAIESSLPPGFTSVGMEVNVRHLDRKRGFGRSLASLVSMQRASSSTSKPGTACARSGKVPIVAVSSTSATSRNASGSGRGRWHDPSRHLVTGRHFQAPPARQCLLKRSAVVN